MGREFMGGASDGVGACCSRIAMLTDQLFVTGAEEPPEDEHDYDRIVELPGDRDEIVPEIQRPGEISGECEQKQLPSAGYPRIAHEPSDKNDARDTSEATGREHRLRQRLSCARTACCTGLGWEPWAVVVSSSVRLCIAGTSQS